MDLDEAYRATVYWVEAPEKWIAIRVGARHPEIDAWAAAPWAFVTADNPGSERRPPEENARRRAALDAELASRRWVRGIGFGPGTAWPPERSRFVIGISREEARALGRRHGQNAVVCGEPGGAAELVWCR